ncbi:MAG: hypothetical protein AB1467_03750 [Candidatus Diapherotrites archaeon]
MKKEWQEDSSYGESPFKKLVKLEFEVKGMNERNDAAFIQFELLKQEPIIRAHIEFNSRKGEVLFNPLDLDSKKALELIPKPFKGIKLQEKEIEYKELLQEGFHL